MAHPTMFEIQTRLNLPTRLWIIGHRGACGESPENTLQSFNLALKQGACMIEMDLQLTADGQIVVVHDWNLERVSGRRITIETSTLATIRAHNVASYFQAHKGVAFVPTLSEVFSELPLSMPLNLELKCLRADPSEYIRRLAVIICEREKLLISSFDWDLLRECRRQLPKALLAPLADKTLDDLLAIADELAAASIHCNYNIVDEPIVRAANSCGRPVMAYTVNDASTAKELSIMGVSGIFTDFPNRFNTDVSWH